MRDVTTIEQIILSYEVDNYISGDITAELEGFSDVIVEGARGIVEVVVTSYQRKRG